ARRCSLSHTCPSTTRPYRRCRRCRRGSRSTACARSRCRRSGRRAGGPPAPTARAATASCRCASASAEMPLTVAYPGRDGAHSAAACERLFPDDTELLPVPSFVAVVEAAVAGAVDSGVLPIESSLSGPVAETHDLLYDSPLSIIGETVLRIRHCLVGPKAVPLESIRVVRSHPAALDQCRALLAALPCATAIAAATTADAASAVAEKGDPTEVAIASERAAALHGLTIVSADVGDHPSAFTRFVSLATYT